jgi:hypothetical protein
VIGILLATGALAACQTSEAPTGPTGPGPTAGPTVGPGLSFSAEVTAAGGQLRVGYRLRNDAAAPVVALNGVPASDTIDDPPVDPNAVYATVRADGVVEIAKRAFAPPPGVNPAAPYQLAGTVVAPGAELTEELTVALPLHGRSPYGDDRLPEPVTRVVFCLGVLPDSMIGMRRDGTADRPVYGHMEFTVAAQRLLCGQPVNVG